jgi:hypothetical protein
MGYFIFWSLPVMSIQGNNRYGKVKYIEPLIDATKEAILDVNAEIAKYRLASPDYNAVRV